MAIFLASVWVHSALAAAALQVMYLDKKVAVDASDLAKLPLLEVEASDHQAKHRYSGVLVRDILGLVGASWRASRCESRPLSRSPRAAALTKSRLVTNA